jgi:L-alanine-DL-glutamate epimerase-like enolase superfamily enzyme
VEIEARIAALRMAETFVISRGASDEAEVVLVELRHDGVSGFGEATPIDRYEESAESALAFVQAAEELLGDDPFALEAIEARLAERPREQAAKAAIDGALHDLCGKLVGLPVWKLLGLRREGPPTSWTIWLGDPDDMARRAERVRGRFKRLKLKLGGGDGLDVERVRAVRGVSDVPLQVDVKRVLGRRRGAGSAASARSARRRVLRAAAPRRRCGRARAEAALAAADLR